MRIVCIFSDRPEMNDHRKNHGADHIAYLEKHESEILVGGGFRDDVEGSYVGGMWILDVTSIERAKELIHNDPYYVPELRSYELKLWGKAIDKPVIL